LEVKEKVKAKLSLSTPRRHTGGTEIQLQPFLNFAIVRE
jgi:hypothetical protein